MRGMDGERERLQRLSANLRRRALIHEITRSFFNRQGFLEVETPIRSPAIAPEREITPLESEGWLLSTSPELYMKRLLAAGYDRIYQISRCFRRGERGPLHNPEFTLLEWYRCAAGYERMMEDTEQLLTAIASQLGMGNTLRYRGKPIDLSLPWKRLTVSEVFRELAGWDPVTNPDGRRFDEDMLLKVVPDLDRRHPVFLVEYPSPMASLARLKPGNPRVAERAELFIGGLELVNTYSELIDPHEQEARFRKEIEQIKQEQNRVAPMPERFVRAVSNLTECAGIALGMDRLAMLFCDAATIAEVMPFTVDEA